MAVDMDFQQVGMALGGLVVGTVAATVFVIQRTSLFGGKKSKDKDKGTDEHAALISRNEFTMAITEMRVKLDEAAQEAREASTAAHAAQSALATIGTMIEGSMRALGDRLEGALRDMRVKVEHHDQQLFSTHGRLTAVETELKINREID